MHCRQRNLLCALATGAALLVWSSVTGCSDRAAAPGGGSPGASAGKSGAPGASSPEGSADSARAAPADREIWEVHLMAGARFGYGRTTMRRATQAGQAVVLIEAVTHHAVKRQGQTTNLESRITSTETPDGKLLAFECEVKMGASPVRTAGRVAGSRLELETTTQGKTVASSTAWSANYGGPLAVNESLWRRPMRPAEQRTVVGLLPELNQVAQVTLTAKDFEPAALLAGTFPLLRIEAVVRTADGQEMRMVHWADRSGDILKTRMDAMSLEIIETTKDVALEETPLPKLDLVNDMTVPVDRPPSDAHRSQRVCYRVHLDDGDPAKEFAPGPTQQIKSIDAHTAEITVFALRPGQPAGNPDAPADAPTDADRQPNNMIQSDDPRVVADAAAAAGQETDSWKVAVALEQYVHREIAAQNFSFSQAFATAAEVAKTREGDCSENAVYLAALARARGIPARVAIGLVYMQSKQAFGYHMWTEMHIAGRWTPMDATLGQGGIGAAHLKIAHSALQGAAAYSSFLPLLRVIGRLKIEVE